MMTYCARIAVCAETRASTVTSTVVTKPTSFWSSTGKACTMLSAKPIV